MGTHDEQQADEAGVRFGRTVVVPSAASIFEHGVEAIVTPANRRGVMGVGIAGLVRLQGGTEIEREAMAQAPLAIGRAIVTASGKLAAHGTKLIIHAVTSDALGAPTRSDTVRKATTAVLQTADRHRIRSLAIPPLGAGLGSGRFQSDTVMLMMIEEIVAHLRRFTSRLDRIVLVCRDERDVRDLQYALNEARRLWWGIRV
ncbi:MAG TPA: macro domain-containing protein [Thermomicrobiales bacterium]|nr:macro domain-containing protein [Thermomicrobiales bacterium]